MHGPFDAHNINRYLGKNACRSLVDFFRTMCWPLWARFDIRLEGEITVSSPHFPFDGGCSDSLLN